MICAPRLDTADGLAAQTEKQLGGRPPAPGQRRRLLGADLHSPAAPRPAQTQVQARLPDPQTTRLLHPRLLPHQPASVGEQQGSA